MEFHRKYNLRSKKSNDNPTKKASEIKKNSYNVPNKVPENKKSKVPTKRIPDSVPRTYQTEVTSTHHPNTKVQKNVANKSYFYSQRRAPSTFSLESELAKLKIHIPLS